MSAFLAATCAAVLAAGPATGAAPGAAKARVRRSTVCLQETNGAWAITHEHASVPFHGSTGQAAVDLPP